MGPDPFNSMLLKQNMETPVPPTLEAFDLDENILARVPKLWFDEDQVIKHFLACTPTFFVFVIFMYHLPLITIATVALGWLFALVPFFIAHYILGWCETKLRSWASEDFRKAQAYRTASTVYLVKKREFEVWLRRQHEAYWRSLSGTAFEIELGKLFSMMGYNVSLTPRTGDGGVDLCLRKDGKLTVVQCKAHKKRIPIGVARELSASMVDFQANSAIIACFEGVTQPVAEYIKNKPITVLKLSEIVDLQKQYG
jgi:hypothetical protein